MDADRLADGDPEQRWNRAFEALAAEPRRRLVDALVDASGAVSLPDAAVAGATVDDERLRVELRHRHLPLLAESGYVEWEQSPFRASRGPRFDEVAAILESLYANASNLPDQLVGGCRILEHHR